MKCDYDIVLDLATDSSESTVSQLTTVVKNKLNGAGKHTVTVLSRTSVDQPFPSGRSVVSENNLDLLFRAKNDLDVAKVTDVLMVTTLVMKKYWETVCLHMFSSVHTWSVLGVDVDDQSLEVRLPNEKDVEANFKEYLKTVGNPKDVRILRSDVIPDDMFNAGFNELYGGVTHCAPMASLNTIYTIRKPDPLLVIKENRSRLAQAAGFDEETLNVAKVEHDKKIWVVGKEQPVKFDGVVTNIPGVTVAAPGADCCMILLADTKTGACGAVHSGWMGTTKGAVRACLKTMVDEFETDPKDIHAAIGPSIEGGCFDMPFEDAKPIIDLDPSLIWPSKGPKSWFHVDLVGANVLMLERDGVLRKNIDTSHALCTVCNKQFFSHRRDGVPFGNQIGFISCTKKPTL